LSPDDELEAAEKDGEKVQQRTQFVCPMKEETNLVSLEDVWTLFWKLELILELEKNEGCQLIDQS
jgi:hypothetical protein